jgi:DNA-binding transcriptional LysR family regulator
LDNLHWPLSVLSKAVHFKNLSGAASHIGVSQPQLSRLVARLEAELGVILLDRAARRKSGWTPMAYRIAETYSHSSLKLRQSLQQLNSDDQIKQISVGSLEGLIGLASEFCQQVRESHPVLSMIELNVYDLSELEAHFERGELDILITCREPGTSKFRFVKNIGFQKMSKTTLRTVQEKRKNPESNSKSGRGLQIFSHFEYAQHTQARRATEKSLSAGVSRTSVLLSNSLAVRKLWIEKYDGCGTIPSEVSRKRKSENDVPVFLIASEIFNPTTWKKFDKFQF